MAKKRKVKAKKAKARKAKRVVRARARPVARVAARDAREYPGARDFVIAQNPFVNGTIVYKKGNFDVELYDLSGREVEKVSGKDRVKIAYKQPSGAYFAKIYGKEGKSEVKKLIKVK